MAKSDYLETGLLNHIFRAVAFPTLGASVHIALFTAAPSDAGGGTEVSGGNYARVAVTRATGSFDAPTASGGSMMTQNTAAITYGVPSANWGSITHFGIFDEATAGNLLYWGALTTPKTVNNGDPAPSFPIGALDILES